MAALDLHSPVPLSRQLAGLLRERYLRGARPGSPLPTLRELAVEFGVGVGVAREAMAALRRDGLVYSRVGIGTFACGQDGPRSGEEQGLTILHFGSGPEGRVISALLDEFRGVEPGCRVRVRVREPATFTSHLAGAAGAGEAADVVFLRESDFLDLGTSHLRRLPGELLARVRDDCDQRALQLFARGRGCYGLPLIFSPVVVFYNRRHFRRRRLPLPGDDWSAGQFLDLADRLTDARQGTCGFCLTRQPNRWLNVLLADGVRVVRRRGRPFFDVRDAHLPASLAGVRAMMARAPVLHDEGALLRAFVEGRVSMIFSSYIGLARILELHSERAGAQERLEIGVSLLPRARTQTSLWMGTGAALARGAPHPRAALRFLRFLLTPRAQALALAQGCGIPALRAAWPGKVWRAGGMSLHGYDAFDRYGPEAQVIGGYRHDPAWERFLQELDLYWSGLQDMETTLTRLRGRAGGREQKKGARR